MTEQASGRPYVLLSCAMSLDGRIDDTSPRRLVLSNEDDLDRVDEVRASCDAILVGANTVRRDNPRLRVRSAARRRRRADAGRRADPLRVTLTASAELDPTAAVFTGPDGPDPDAVLVYAPESSAGALAGRLAGRATVVPGAGTVDLVAVLDDLGARGVRRLLVEGGTGVFTGLLTAGLADELHLAIAPVFVGDQDAPRFVHDGQFSWHAANPARLVENRRIDDIVLLRYLLGADRFWLNRAIALAHRCQPSPAAFNVGAVIVDAQGNELSTGYSRDTDDTVHAEESALAKLDPDDPRLRTATIYSSLEPCGRRKSRSRSCAELILRSGIPRVVFALREPSTFVVGTGAERLAAGGVDVVELSELAEGVQRANNHLW